MRRMIEGIERCLPHFVRSALGRLHRPEENPLLGKYTYTQITQVCDQVLARMSVSGARSLLTFRNASGGFETYEQAYNQLSQPDSPAPITAAVIIGLAREGNLQPSDVDELKRTNFLLRTVYGYRNFCDAIDQSIRRTDVMKESSRPDFASFRQLASLATLSHRTLESARRSIRYQPYVTLDGKRILRGGDFMDSLGRDNLAGACIRFVVDLGILTTRPEQITAEEKEWCRRKMHLNLIVGNSSLNERLEKFKELVSIQ